MFLLGNLSNGGAWIPYALLLAALVGAHAGLRAVRHHRRRATGYRQAVSRPPGNLARWGRRRRLPLLALALAAATGAGLLVASPWQRPGPAPPTVERALAAVLHAGAPGLVGQRWSCRSVASTISAILPGGSLRHRDAIFFRWARSRSATKVSVWRDSGSAH
jgi:hypothetical protein